MNRENRFVLGNQPQWGLMTNTKKDKAPPNSARNSMYNANSFILSSFFPEGIVEFG